ncbi:MAG: heat-inducible transcription repressor HrcA [Actinomycetia bacterium]|nr:heat-inducible transcription repressor HrcA [Actinomycetes bacterium]
MSAETQDLDELDDRKASVLRAVVEHYIGTAQPVGSGVLAGERGLEVSSATIRSEMSSLENLGFLQQPHTSAGRVPTEKGYRYFVDELGGEGTLAAPEARKVKDFFTLAQGAIEDRLRSTSQLLSSLTPYTGVVVGPSHDPAIIRSVQVVLLSPGRALVVLVLSSGTVERHEIEIDESVDEVAVGVATTHLMTMMVGHAPSAIGEFVSSGRTDVDGVAATALNAIVGTDDGGRVFVGSAANMAAQFDAVDTVRSVLTILEHQLMVVTMISDLLDRGLSVAIGSETGLPLTECSVVVAPLEVDGARAGSVGVLGPTRMDYPRALAAVNVVSERLGESLSTETD